VDELSAVASVWVRLDSDPWLQLTASSMPDQWHGLLTAPGQGIRMLSIRALDASANEQIYGPVPLCREDSPWNGFADGFELPAVAVLKLGFEKTGCGALPPAAKTWVDWWLGADGKAASMSKESSHAPR
jgi:hypothetical protein